MYNLRRRGIVLSILGAGFLLTGCAYHNDAVATANQALQVAQNAQATANQAQQTALTAQQSVDQARARISAQPAAYRGPRG
jgi:uncharacterized protein YcfL